MYRPPDRSGSIDDRRPVLSAAGEGGSERGPFDLRPSSGSHGRGSRLPAVVGPLLAAAIMLGAGERVQAQVPVDLELAIAVDVSSSVTQAEYGLQMAGIAAAFRRPDVVAAIEGLGLPGMAACLIHWSGSTRQKVAVEWTLIRDRATAVSFAARVERAPRSFIGETAVGAAIAYAGDQITENGYLGRRLTIDVSGDGDASYGVLAQRYRDQAVARGITVNALAILTDDPNLAVYYRDNVIGGPNAFVMSAADYDDFVEAMTRKLLREIPPVIVRNAPYTAPRSAAAFTAQRRCRPSRTTAPRC